MTVRNFFHSRSALISAILVASLFVLLFFPNGSHRFQGSLLDTQVLTAFDTDHDGVFTIREMRKAVSKMIRAIAFNDLTYDLNRNRITNREDLTQLIQSIRAYLSAVCRNGSIEAGEQCDDGNATDNDSCTNGCKIAVATNTDSTCKKQDDFFQSKHGGCRNVATNITWSSLQTNVPTQQAALGLCKNLTSNGFDDWSLPTAIEMTDVALRSASEYFDFKTDQLFWSSSISDGKGVIASLSDTSQFIGNANVSYPVVCTRSGICGNGVKEGKEQCDDGNADNTDECLTSCTLPACGDGFVRAGIEECDDGNSDNTDACTTLCKNPVCGDGFKQGSEECDGGNAVNTDSCTAVCKNPVCGDGFKQGSEQCDAGNQNGVVCDSGSARFACQYCSSACILTMHSNPAVCGNGIVEPGEGCDDGNTLSQDDCSSACNAEYHYACVDYACSTVLGFGSNTCGDIADSCLPPRNDGITAEITTTARPMTMYTPTTVNVTIHPDKIRSGVTADFTLGFGDTNYLDEVTFDPRCTKIAETGTNFPRFHLSCALGTINPSADIHLAVNFESVKCAGVTSDPSGIFDSPTTLLIKDTAPRPVDAPPIFPLKVGLPYKCTMPPVVRPAGRIDAACTAGRFGLGPNDYYSGFAHVDDSVRHESHIFTQATGFFRYFRYNDADHTIGAETIPIEGPGFVYDARWDDAHSVVYLLHQARNGTTGQLIGGLTVMCFDPATKLINGGACPPEDRVMSDFPVSSLDGYRTAWKRCFLNSR